MSTTSLLFFVPLRLCFAFLLVYEDGWGAIFALGVCLSLSMSIYLYFIQIYPYFKQTTWPISFCFCVFPQFFLHCIKILSRQDLDEVNLDKSTCTEIYQNFELFYPKICKYIGIYFFQILSISNSSRLYMDKW